MYIVLILLVAFMFAVAGSTMASSRGRSAFAWGVICFFTGIFGVVVLAILGVSDNVAQTRTMLTANGTAAPDFQRWSNLVEVDPEIASAAASARAHSMAAERILAEKYLSLNDKQYLSAVLAKSIEQAEHAANNPPTGTIGSAKYKRLPDGSFLITKGKSVGRVFADYNEMARHLGNG